MSEFLKVIDNNKIFYPELISLKGVDEFRQPAITFMEQKCYTKYPDNSLSGKKYWEEQAYNSIYGFTNSYGIRITGYHYWYLNFCPIIKTQVLGEDDGESQLTADRIEGFPDLWDGDYLYYHYMEQAELNGKFACVLGGRGCGKSYKAASMLNRNYFLIPLSKGFVFASDKQYLFEDGIITKTWAIMDFIDNNTAWAKRRHGANQRDHRMSGIKKNIDGTEILTGFRSEITALSIGDDYNKVRGKRGKLLFFEEAGSFKDMYKAWNIVHRSATSGRASFGLVAAFGTGGDTNSAHMMSLEDMFYKPKAYYILPCQNIWDKVVTEKSESCFFFPSYVNRILCMDKNGNSLKDKAIQELEKEGEHKKKTSKLGYLSFKAENPIHPQDALMRVTGSIFPVDDLKEVLGNLQSNEKLYRDSQYIGNLLMNETGDIRWESSDSCIPIEEFPLNGNSNDAEGCVVIWQHPLKDTLGNVTQYKYIIGTDPYDDDGKSESLGSSIVLDLMTDKIVAEYTGRPETAEKYFETLRRLAKYYNAEICYENNKKGLFSYFDKVGATWMLADTPKNLKDNDFIKIELTGNKAKGFRADEYVNNYGRQLIKTWLIKPYKYEEDSTGVKNMHKIRSITILKELIYWNTDDNFDRVSALAAVMIYREACIKYFNNIEKQKDSVDKDIENFFSKHKDILNVNRNNGFNLFG
jgi:hypothetical protein